MRGVAQLVDDAAVGEEDGAVRVARRVRVVGHHHHRLVELVDAATQEGEDLGGRRRVEVAGGLVAEDDVRPVHQRPRAGHALLLPAGQLRWLVRQPVAEAEDVDDPVEPLLVDRLPRDRQRQDDVLARRQRRDEVEGLEHEADALAAELRQRRVGQGADGGVAEPDLPGRRGVERGHEVHERRLAGPGRAHDRGELALDDVEVDPVERRHDGIAGAIGLGEALGPSCNGHALNRISGASAVEVPLNLPFTRHVDAP